MQEGVPHFAQYVIDMLSIHSEATDRTNTINRLGLVLEQDGNEPNAEAEEKLTCVGTIDLKSQENLRTTQLQLVLISISSEEGTEGITID